MTKAAVVVYVAIAGAALFLTWSNNIKFFGERRIQQGQSYNFGVDLIPAFSEFFREAISKSPASTLATVELLSVAGAFAVQFKADGIRLGVRFAALYLFLSYMVAISVLVPVFYAVSHAARHKQQPPAAKRETGASFPFFSTITYIIITASGSYVMKEIANTHIWMFAPVMVATYFCAPLSYHCGPASIGSSVPRKLSRSGTAFASVCYGIALGNGVLTATMCRLPLILSVISKQFSAAAFLSDSLDGYAVSSITWDYILLALAFSAFVVFESPRLSFISKLVWVVFGLVVFPVAAPLFFILDLQNDTDDTDKNKSE